MHKIWDLNKGALLVFLSVLGLFLINYNEVILHPNSYLFSGGGDGLKNYYTYLFHAKYDNDFWNFSGMNYPYGENIVYTDAHPLLSYLIGLFGLEKYGIGIVNVFMLFSFPLAGFFLFKILKRFNLPFLWAFIAAVVYAMLSPQIFRLGGHLSLSYAFAIPLIWWLLILARKSKPILWSLAIALVLTSFFYTHPYLGMIMMSFIAAFWLIELIFVKEQRWLKLLYFGIQVIIPFVLFRLLISLNDSHLNRLGEPAGFFQYYASWKSIFVPFFGPIAYLKEALKINVGNWESWSYVGFFTAVFGFIVLIFILNHIKQLRFRSFLKTDLAKYMLAASLVLMFAFCFPIKYWWAKWITEYFGAIKQFRVLGRFTWVFYYVFTAFVIVSLYKVYLRKNKPKWILIIFLFGAAFTLVESFAIHRTVSKSLVVSKNTFLEENLDDDLKEIAEFLKNERPDAIMFLPFQHMSSENIMMLGTEEANTQAFLISYHTGIPLMNSISSRMSLDEAIMFNNFFGPEFVYKDLVDEIPSNAKVLLVKNNQQLTTEEQKILWTQEKLFENKEFHVFSWKNEDFNKEFYYKELLKKAPKEPINYYYNSLDFTEEFSLDGKASYKGVKDSWHVFDTIKKTDLPEGEYQASFWYYLGVNRPDMAANCEYIYPDSNIVATDYDIKQSKHIVNNWCRVELNFTFKENVDMMRFSVVGNASQEPFYIDEFYIIPQADTLLQWENVNGEKYLNYNNFRIKPWPTF